MPERFDFGVVVLPVLVEEVVVVLRVFAVFTEDEEVPPPNLINIEALLGFLIIEFAFVEINTGKVNEPIVIALFPNVIKLNFLLLK